VTSFSKVKRPYEAGKFAIWLLQLCGVAARQSPWHIRPSRLESFCHGCQSFYSLAGRDIERELIPPSWMKVWALCAGATRRWLAIRQYSQDMAARQGTSVAPGYRSSASTRTRLRRHRRYSVGWPNGTRSAWRSCTRLAPRANGGHQRHCGVSKPEHLVSTSRAVDLKERARLEESMQ